MAHQTGNTHCQPRSIFVAILVSNLVTTITFLGLCLAYISSATKLDLSSLSLASDDKANQGIATLPRLDASHPRETCLDPLGPQPFILLSLGRSGSSSTWQIIGNLTGQETRAEEYTGRSPQLVEKFFEQYAGEYNDKWLLEHLCSKQLRYPDAKVVGFKWKPSEVALSSPPAMAGLHTMASLKRPQIKIVRLRRNLLDFVISTYKHSINNSTTTPAHCFKSKGKEDCAKKAKEASIGLELPTSNLAARLRKLTSQENEIDKILMDMKVPHVQVKYEELYYGMDASEWMEIFRFLGVGPAEGLTKEQVQGATKLVATNTPMHNITLANFEEVERVLKGTQFESLLH